GRTGLVFLGERLRAAALLASDGVDRAAVHEREDPRARLRALLDEPIGRAPDGEEGLLHRVLRERVVAEDPPREPVGHAAEAVVQLGERGVLGASDEREQGLVAHVPEGAALLPRRRGHQARGRRRAHHALGSVWKTGELVGRRAPPFRSTVTATLLPRGTGFWRRTIVLPLPPRKTPAGVVRPEVATQASYVLDEGARFRLETTSAARRSPPTSNAPLAPTRPTRCAS